ncbi:PREDICTED: probable plastid-lipid-associated protein 6, chloroplastic [Populus euphratica]|uniref:Probable plastid-lipid-associated protein 6, chloroplastic n=1 Tax=Populus euphratica TaxID=75702 RepID=A0AAJ6UH42_POPEU|nr:PREDICTED: probable plastid-lipid-associated protein 6, chloroplastic [Populus euphratica]XP_011029793.1 PREDICTED: probable plastid-lipid-associated protein 6, chloroplastic [Populus euphratica]
MASVSSPLHPPVFSLSPSPPAARCKLPSKVRTVQRTSPSPHETRTGRDSSYTRHRQRNVVLRSALDEINVLDPPPSSSYEEGKSEPIASLKLKLLSVVSGLNRGLAAGEDDQQKADAAAKDLEAAGGLVDLSKDIDKLQGRWKLIYSSAFSSRTLGGSRPGPPTGRLLPITLGQVFQRIDVLSKDFDNIVELELGAPWPLQPVEVTATLAHKFELIGSAKIKITFEKTTVKTTGNLSQLPPLEVPRIPDALRPPSNTGSGEFEVTYLDADTRVTRGDRSELRVFVLS